MVWIVKWVNVLSMGDNELHVIFCFTYYSWQTDQICPTFFKNYRKMQTWSGYFWPAFRTKGSGRKSFGQSKLRKKGGLGLFQNFQGNLFDHVLNLCLVLQHVRSREVSLQVSESFPFFHNRHDVWVGTYEMNIVISDGSRVTLVRHCDKASMVKDAEKLSIFLGKPIWNTA